MDDPGSTRDEPPEPPLPASIAASVHRGPAAPTAAHPTPVEIDVLDPAGRLTRAQRQRLIDQAGACAAFLEARGEVRVRILDDHDMALAHARYKGVDGPTDVLTFDFNSSGDPSSGELNSGTPPAELDVDILICIDEAQRQAATRAGDPQHELLLYILHGMLHCLGYDDLSPADAAAMHQREDEVLTAIGVGPVYAVDGSPQDGSPQVGSAERAGGGPWA